MLLQPSQNVRPVLLRVHTGPATAATAASLLLRHAACQRLQILLDGHELALKGLRDLVKLHGRVVAKLFPLDTAIMT